MLSVLVTQCICSGQKVLFVPQYYLPAAHQRVKRGTKTSLEVSKPEIERRAIWP